MPIINANYIGTYSSNDSMDFHYDVIWYTDSDDLDQWYNNYMMWYTMILYVVL